MRVSRLAVGLVALVSGCAAAGEPAADRLTISIAPAGYPAAPIDNDALPGTPLAEARAHLGRRLFFDPRLSRTGGIACATCHRPDHGFADLDAVSAGVDGRRGTRNAPALVNLAWTEHLFWDGRVPTLEQQSTMPIENPDEMDLPLAEAIARVNADPAYGRAFADAYAGVDSETALRRSLATFIRSLVSGQSPYDRFLRGDNTALLPGARRGMQMFFSDKAGCFHCHPSGPLTNDGFFNNGSYVTGGDVGRSAITGRSGDLGKFKVPGLRNVAATGPYMHDGSVATLQDAIEQYARGGRGGPNTDAVIVPLLLTEDDKADLVAFLRALTDDRFLNDPRYP